MSKPEAAISGPPMLEKIEAARNGDEQALEDVIRHYQDRIAGYVVALVGKTSADLDDLCQIVFLRMALSLPKLRSVEAFEPWLFRIARNVCRDHLRRLSLRNLFVPLSSVHDAILGGQSPEELRATVSALQSALRKLSGAQREVIDLLCRREYSYEELARLTKTSVRAVAGRLCRARASLRKLLRYNATSQ
jgi:RNA polymerase sigma-70 factor (ECF subfamily)